MQPLTSTAPQPSTTDACDHYALRHQSVNQANAAANIAGHLIFASFPAGARLFNLSMPMLTLPGRQLVFVVRIRLESASGIDTGSPVLRGSVQLLGSEPQRYFALLEALPRILQNMLDQADATDVGNPDRPGL